MKNQKFLIAAILLAGMLFSACTIRINTEVQADGSGTTSTEIGFTDEEVALLSEIDETPATFCDAADDEEGFPQSATQRIENREDGTYCVIEVPFNSLSELRDFYADGEGIVVNRLEFVDDVFYYDMMVDMTMEDAADFEGAGVDFEFNWSVTMPGEVQSHNADRVEGSTLTWDLTPGVNRSIQAQSTTSSGISLDFGGEDFSTGIGTMEILIILFCCLCLLVLAGGGIAGFVFMRRRQGEN